MKILMVCLGNICRSPLAEGILKQKIDSLELDWEVDSCGTSGWHDGEKPDKRSIEIAFQNNVNISNQISRKITSEDINYYDKILVMDASNYQNVLRMFPNMDKTKMELILNYLYPKENRAVPDPYYDNSFENAFILIDKACDQLIQQFSDN